MRTVLLRAVAPRTSSTSRKATPKASARKVHSAALALPSTAGAARRIFSRWLAPVPCMPAISLRLAPGCACSCRVTEPSAPVRHHARSCDALTGTLAKELRDGLLEPRYRQHQQELREHDDDQRRKIEHAAQRRDRAPYRREEAERQRIEHAGQR